jgi:hypothetical protein
MTVEEEGREKAEGRRVATTMARGWSVEGGGWWWWWCWSIEERRK